MLPTYGLRKLSSTPAS